MAKFSPRERERFQLQVDDSVSRQYANLRQVKVGAGPGPWLEDQSHGLADPYLRQDERRCRAT